MYAYGRRNSNPLKNSCPSLHSFQRLLFVERHHPIWYATKYTALHTTGGASQRGSTLLFFQNVSKLSRFKALEIMLHKLAIIFTA
jgi:hypothetical protein